MEKQIGKYFVGNVIIEGKTKQVYDIPKLSDQCLILSKDRITAGDGIKSHELAGKSEISNLTNGKVFEVLNKIGVKTAYIEEATSNSFLAKKCEMIPIEWVSRRLATGSFLKRNPGVPEGYRFNPPKQETFFKDDANHDPQWSDEQILSAKFKFNNVVIGQREIDVMKKTALVVFEILEKMWATRDCALIDMKIEFGVDKNNEIVLADIIDSDSWRLWPAGDKRLMVDKQVYRNLSSVSASDLETVKRNFIWVSKQLENIYPISDHLIVIMMGSKSDMDHAKAIIHHCEKLGLKTALRVSSAHKSTQETLRILHEYEGTVNQLVFVAVAGRSNGLGPVLSGNTVYPVINCPPAKPTDIEQDIWSSLNTPSGLGCVTVRYPEAAALHAAQIIGIHDYTIWGRLRVRQLNNLAGLMDSDAETCKNC